MRGSRRLLLLFTGLFFLAYMFFCTGAWKWRDRVRQETRVNFVLPSRFSRVLAFGYKGVLSDFQFLKITTFLGERFLRKTELTEEDWDFFKKSVDVITDLDPYFLDPYFLAEGLMTWDAGEIKEANRLLEKGVSHRTWDWRLPYFVGFNNFYFLHDYNQGAKYVMAASRIPGAPNYLPTLAARLAYYAEKPETAILFLREMIAESRDPQLLKSLKTRLLALERAALLEKAVKKFKASEGREPKAMVELVTKGYLDGIPLDPYGGRWGILRNGRVFSTSKFAPPKPGEKQAEDKNK